MIELIADRNRFRGLNHLFDFLAAWEERLETLTRMAYEWCSAICEAAGRLELAGTRTSQEIRSPSPLRGDFSQFGSNGGPPRLDNPSHFRGRLQGSTSGEYLNLHAPLKIAFRMFGPSIGRLPIKYLYRTPHDDRVFEVAFSSDDDEVIADAACAWVISCPSPISSCARYFVERVGNPRPFSRRLRGVAIDAIVARTFKRDTTPDSGVVRLLNRLDACVGDLHSIHSWRSLLKDVIRSPAGGNPSSHYRRLLDELQSMGAVSQFEMGDVEVMRSLEEAEDWEKLEVWIAATRPSRNPTPVSVEAAGDATLKLILLRPSTLQRFENLLKRTLSDGARAGLVEALDRARFRRLALEAQHPPYVSVCSSPFLPVLTPSSFPSSKLVPTESFIP